jgi:hypothetical protein
MAAAERETAGASEANDTPKGEVETFESGRLYVRELFHQLDGWIERQPVVVHRQAMAERHAPQVSRRLVTALRTHRRHLTLPGLESTVAATRGAVTAPESKGRAARPSLLKIS